MMEEGDRCTRAKCGPCKEYEPPRHILKWCGLYAREGVLCMKAKSACETCSEKSTRPPGEYGPDEKRQTDAQYRQEHADKVAKSREEFFKRNPNYMRDYMRAYRAKKKAGGNDDGCS